jgi:hypothetical protein
MEITQKIRKMGPSSEAATGMETKSQEFREGGFQIYRAESGAETA